MVWASKPRLKTRRDGGGSQGGLTAWPGWSDRVDRGASRSFDRRTRDVIVKLASEGSKFAVDAVPAE